MDLSISRFNAFPPIITQRAPGILSVCWRGESTSAFSRRFSRVIANYRIGAQTISPGPSAAAIRNYWPAPPRSRVQKCKIPVPDFLCTRLGKDRSRRFVERMFLSASLSPLSRQIMISEVPRIGGLCVISQVLSESSKDHRSCDMIRSAMDSLCRLIGGRTNRHVQLGRTDPG